MIKAIIVDDEQLSIDTLQWELKTHCSNVNVIFSTNNPKSAIDVIDTMKPDVLFLDVEMPELDGFQLLNSLEFRDFDLIFTTAYDNYAIKALKMNAIDYLLKPIEKEDLLSSIKKVMLNKENKSLGDNLKTYIQDSLQHIDHKSVKIALPMEKKIVLVDQKEIMYCESNGSYTNVFMENNTSHIVSKNLKQLMLQLDQNRFIRIHQSFIINIDSIGEYHRGDGGEIVLKNGKNLPVSRNKKQELLKNILK